MCHAYGIEEKKPDPSRHSVNRASRVSKLPQFQRCRVKARRYIGPLATDAGYKSKWER